jgi:hypothetical protein
MAIECGGAATASAHQSLLDSLMLLTVGLRRLAGGTIVDIGPPLSRCRQLVDALLARPRANSVF